MISLHRIKGAMVFAATICAPLAAQTPIRLLTDTNLNGQQEFGGSVGVVGDLDGDGQREVTVSTHLDAFSLVDVFVCGTGAILRQHLSTQTYEKLGRAVLDLGDIDADGVSDYAIGAEGYDVTSPTLLGDAGRVLIFSGASGALLQEIDGPTAGLEMGYSLAAVGDVDGDTLPDILIGSSGSGAWVYTTAGTLIHSIPAPVVNERFGQSVAGMGDLNGDGRAEFAVGNPQSFTTTGFVRVYNGYDKSVRYTLTGPSNNSRFGQCICRLQDVDGDGMSDLAVGAPLFFATSGGAGLVRVYSGSNGGFLYGINGQNSNENFGTWIATGGDLTGDGLPDMVVGAPARANVNLSGAGAARCYSTATGLQAFEVRGSAGGSHVGQVLAVVGDIDGDGRADLLSTGMEEVVTGAGILFSGACAAPLVYCTAKVNSLGCTPAISYTGNPSLHTTDDFHIRATNVINNKPGLLIYGFKRQVAPLFGGTLCVSALIRRTPGQSSAGNPPPNDCSGIYDFFLGQAALALDPLASGQTLYAQIWMRDPGFAVPENIGLTDALRFTICD